MKESKQQDNENQDQENHISPGAALFLIVLGLGIMTAAVILLIQEEYESGGAVLGLGLITAITGAIPYTYRKK